MYKYGIIETENRMGKAGKDIVLTWLFEENGTLSIFGAGLLPDYRDGQERPWQEYADRITAVVIDDGITSVGARTFSGYEKLESVKLPDSMSRIGFRAFADCPALRTVAASKTIAHSAVTNLASAARGVLRADTIYLGMQSFANTPWISQQFGEFYIHRDVLVEYYGTGGKVIVPDGIREIGTSAFENTTVTAVKLPGSLKIVGTFAFNKTAIRVIELPASVKRVERYAFAQTGALESVLIGNPQVELDEKAFWQSAAEEAVQPGKNGWNSVYHIESVREAGLDPFKRLEIRRDSKKLVGVTTLECGKAIVKKLSSGGSVLRVVANPRTKIVESVHIFIRDGKEYTSIMEQPVLADGKLVLKMGNTSYLTKAEMEEMGGIGLWPQEVSSGRFWYQAPKNVAPGVVPSKALLKAWLSKHPEYRVAEEA